MGTHRRVGIQVHDAAARRGHADGLDVFHRMHAGEIGDPGLGRFVTLEQPRDSRGNQLILDRGKTRRTLRMVASHVVLAAVAVGNERDGHFSAMVW